MGRENISITKHFFSKGSFCMKRKFLALSLAAVMVLSFTACSTKESGSISDDVTAVSSESTSETADSDTEETYQSVFVEYSEKLEEKAAVLVDEFNEEASDKGGDADALEELRKQKTEALSKVCTEGVVKMSNVMVKNRDAYTTYDEWVRNLYGEFEEQSQLITDAYVNVV